MVKVSTLEVKLTTDEIRRQFGVGKNTGKTMTLKVSYVAYARE